MQYRRELLPIVWDGLLQYSSLTNLSNTLWFSYINVGIVKQYPALWTIDSVLSTKYFIVPEWRLFFQLFPTGIASWKNSVDIFVKSFEKRTHDFFIISWRKKEFWTSVSEDKTNC